MGFNLTNVPFGCGQFAWKLLHLLREDDVRQEVVYGTLSVSERRKHLLYVTEPVLEIDAIQTMESRQQVWSVSHSCIIRDTGPVEF